jgi:hypothetical protein
MRRAIAAGTMMGLLMLPAPAPGEDTDGAFGVVGLSIGELQRLCTEGSPICRSYVAGVVDTAMLNHLLFSERRDRGFVGPGFLSFCFPAEEALADPVPVFMAFASARPEEAAYSAAEGVLRALRARYPCDQGGEQ